MNFPTAKFWTSSSFSLPSNLYAIRTLPSNLRTLWVLQLQSLSLQPNWCKMTEMMSLFSSLWGDSLVGGMFGVGGGKGVEIAEVAI
eukprot:2952116-Ditylum_brightwellii.AAC.1